MKSPKMEFHDDDDDFLEDLVVDTNLEAAKKLTMYSNLKPGGFIMKAEDRKGKLEKRQARIATAKEQDNDDDDDDDDDEETEKKTARKGNQRVTERVEEN